MQATQTSLFDTDSPSSTTDPVAFDIGLSYARLGLPLPRAYAQGCSPLTAGWQLARERTTLRMVPTVHHRRWLSMRLRAWLHGHQVDLLQVNPNYVAQLDAPLCPVTRESLLGTSGRPVRGHLSRLRPDAAWAPGHLVLVSTSAMHAMHRVPTERPDIQAQQEAQHVQNQQAAMNADAWRRLAVLHSFVQQLPHEEAARIPLLVLPPNRVQMFNPIQALQAYLTRQLLQTGWSQRLSRMEHLMPSTLAAHALRDVVLAMVPRVLSLHPGAGNMNDRHALEDAWKDARLQQRWQTLATHLTPEQCEAIVQRAQAQYGGAAQWRTTSVSQALETWSISTKGYAWPTAA